MRVRVPHGSEDKRLRFHGLWAQVKQSEKSSCCSCALNAVTALLQIQNGRITPIVRGFEMVEVHEILYAGGDLYRQRFMIAHELAHFRNPADDTSKADKATRPHE